MGRKSKLTDRQWERIGKRLLAGESGRALAKEFGVSEATIRARFSTQVAEIKSVANQIVATDAALKALPISAQVAAHILKSLGGDVPEFRMPVTFKRLDGTDATITFTAKALRKTEWAAMRDALTNPEKAEAETADEAAPVEPFSFAKAIGSDMKKGAELVMKFASGWELDDEFSAANLIDMEDRFGGSLSLTLQAYDAAIWHGRLGN